MNFIDNFQSYDLPNFGYTRLPKPPITEEDKRKYDFGEKDTNYKFLSNLCDKGFKERLKNGKIPELKIDEYKDRIKLELDTFYELNFTDYILFVWKVVNKAKELGVFMDFGRGSVSSSLVASLIGICNCDAIKYKLFFSRFLSKARAKSKIIDKETWVSIELAPDIDINLGESRDDIVKWLKEIYPNRISKVANVSTLTGKILIKDVYKAYEEISEEEAKRVADLVERRFGVVQDIEEVYKENEEFKEWADKHKETYDISCKLRGLNSAFGCHASGYLVSFDELYNHTPLMLNKDRELMSCYTMDDVQCLKLDLLSLDTNRIIKNIIESTNEDVSNINLENDEFIYRQLQSEELLPYGLYQLSGDCAYKVCKHIKPKNVVELSHVNAIARPVGLMYEKPYIENKEDCPEIFKNSLKFSHYQPLYQENLIAMVKDIGFDEESAEQFRRVFAKKKTEEVDIWIEKIKTKLKENDIEEKTGEYLLKIAKESASYQFNFSHSVSTSLLSALTVYLKYKHPLQFYHACLNEVHEKPNSNELVGDIFKELRKFNIQILKPNILKSKTEFTIEDGAIRFGIGNLKGIGLKAIDKLQEFKHEYSNLFDIFVGANEAGLNITAMCSLIESGAMDDFIKANRSQIVLDLQTWNILTPREQKRALELGKEFNYNIINIIKYLSKCQNGAEKPFIKESRLITLREKFSKYKKMFNINSENEELNSYFWEKEILGFSYSHDLFDILRKNRDNVIKISEAKTEIDNFKVEIGGEIMEIKSGTSKNKNKYIKCKIYDGSDSVDIFLMEKNFDENNRLNNNKKLEKGDIVLCSGQKKGDIIFCDKIVSQSVKIILRSSEIKIDKKEKKD